MLTNPFGRKSNKVQKILKLGDQLSLSLRENVELIDTDDALITFVTESGHVIEGEFDFDTLEYSNIQVTTTEIFENNEIFDNVVTGTIKDILGALLEDNRRDASNTFSKVLHLWEARSRYDRVIERINERKERYNLYASIVESEQFDVMNELKPQLIKFLKENKEEVKKEKVIVNSIKLSNTISNAFNLPQISPENLMEGSFHITDRRFDSVYDIVCRQELIKKDLLENKKAFNSLWLNSNEVNTLIEFIDKNNDKKLSECLSTIINTNPYFALATKKQLLELIENSLSFQDINVFSKKEVKKFVTKIYEAKREVKNVILENLNDKYGINLQNLKTTPSFSDLGKTQKTIFESLQKIAPRGSALKTAISDFTKVLGLHSGVDVIDINEWLVDLFVEADYAQLINETSLLNYMNFDKVAGDLSKIGQVLKMIQAGMGGEMMPEDGQYEPEGSAEEDMASAMSGEEAPEMGGEEAPEMGGEEEGMEDESMPEEGEDGDLPEQSPEEAAMGAEEDMEAETGNDEDGEGEGDGGQMEQDEFMSYLEDLEGLIDSLKSNMGVGGGEEDMGDEGDEEGMEEEGEEMPEEEGEEEMPEEDDSEEGEEKDIPQKKKKPFPPKE